MEYEEKKKLIEAAKVLKEHCDSRLTNKIYCDGCPFERDGDRCWLMAYAYNWNIPKLTRWTPEDVALAKALKAFGVKSVERVEKGLVLYRMNSITYGMLPYGSFNSLRLDETVDLDTIIEEAEV